MKMKLLVLVLSLIINLCTCLKPVRLGRLDPTNTNTHSISGLVYLLNRQAIYVKDFSFILLSGQDMGADGGYFCAGTSSGAFVIPRSGDLSSFSSGSSFDHAEFVLPAGKNISELQWFGVCDDSAASVKLASIAVHPSLVRNLPCNTTLLGTLSASEYGIGGRAYLVDRLTYAILGFSYTHQENEDVVFWTGSGSPSINGYHCSYGDDIVRSLPSINDQDLVVNIPEDVGGKALSYLSVWSRSSLFSLSSVAFSSGVFPPAPPPITAWYLGSLIQSAHNVQGEVYAVDNKTILISGFHFDGNAPATYFRAIIGTSRFSRQHAIIPDEEGSLDALGVYVNRTITLTLPENYTVQNIGFVAVWCYAFDINFGDVNLNGVSRDLSPSRSVQVYPALPHPDELCPAVSSETADEINCKQLNSDITMSWVVDRQQEEIVIELCGCVLTDNYVAFGLSGSESRISMFGSDVTWTWMDNQGVHAEELNINAYSQCQITKSNGVETRNGACPDTQNDVHSVSGYRDGCKTCIKYSRSLQSTDPNDKAFELGQNQWVIWSVGPVGSLQTPADGIIPVPFKHYLRADYDDPLQVNFSRSPLNECQQLQCSGCDVPLTPWRQPLLDLGDSFTVHARIGQSGGQRGYAGITGISGWGIAWYLNELLIPKIELYRGFEYTFIVEGGDDPTNPARYHPFYITNNERGGYLVKSEEERKDEIVYAGIDTNGNPLGVGRYCEYRNQLRDRSDEFDTFHDYRETLELFCLNGTAGQFTWKPDQNTPDTVYYQCASHQFLGWKMDIVEPPAALLPIEIHLFEGSPLILGENVTVYMALSKPASKPVVFQLWNRNTRKFTNFPWQYQSGTIHQITLSGLEPADYRIRLIAEGDPGDRKVYRRSFTLPENPLDCSPYLTGEGISIDGDTVTFTFASTGIYSSFSCQLDRNQPVSCDDPFVMNNMSVGEHRLRITPTECEGNSSRKAFKFCIGGNGSIIQLLDDEVCPPVDVPSTQQSMEVTPPTSLAPTSQDPTSQAPISQAPTSQAPTSRAPTSQALTSLASTSGAPTSLAPTSQAPTSRAPTSQAPTSRAPTSLAPTSRTPTSRAPTSLAPTSRAPTSLAPTSRAPTSLVRDNSGCMSTKAAGLILNTFSLLTLAMLL